MQQVVSDIQPHKVRDIAEVDCNLGAMHERFHACAHRLDSQLSKALPAGKIPH